MIKKILTVLAIFFTVYMIPAVFVYLFQKYNLFLALNDRSVLFIFVNTIALFIALVWLTIFLKIPLFQPKQIYTLGLQKDVILAGRTLLVFLLFLCFASFYFYYDSFINGTVNSIRRTKLGFLNTVIISPIKEELIFRGILINYFLRNKKLNRWQIILLIISISVIFSIVHYDFTPYYLAQFFIFSVIVSIIYYYQRNIYTVILFHSIANLFVFIFNYYQSDFRHFLLSKELYFIFSLIFFGLIIYTLFRLAKSYRIQ